MKIVKSKLPALSILHHLKSDYSDSFEGVFVSQKNIQPSDVGKAFFRSSPKWIDHLFVLRNKMVAVFGLKTSGNVKNRAQQLQDFKCESGERLGLFKVFDKTENEVILGEDDKHLNFRVSLFLENDHLNKLEYKIIITTTVLFHNRFGKLYFSVIRPFHRLIVPKMLSGIMRELNSSQI